VGVCIRVYVCVCVNIAIMHVLALSLSLSLFLRYARELQRKDQRNLHRTGQMDRGVANTLSQGGPQAQWEGKTRQKNAVGGGWGDDDASETYTLPTQSNGSEQQQTFGNPTTFPDQQQQYNYEDQPTPRSDGIYERGLIEKATTASGIRGTIAPKELNAFVASCRALDLVCVSEILDERLADPNAAVKNKALCIVEALLGQGWAESVDDHFRASFANVQACKGSNNAGVRKKAAKILVLLGAEEEQPIAQQQQQQPQQQTSIIEGLDFGGNTGGSPTQDASAFAFLDAAPTQQQQQQPQTSSAPLSGMEGLFGDMSVSASSSTTATSGDSTGLADIFGVSGDTTASNKPKTDVMAMFDTPSQPQQQQQQPFMQQQQQQQGNTQAHDIFFGGNLNAAPQNGGNPGSFSRSSALNDPAFDAAMFGGNSSQQLGGQNRPALDAFNGLTQNNTQIKNTPQHNTNNAMDAFFTTNSSAAQATGGDASFMVPNTQASGSGFAQPSKKKVNDAFSFITLQ
jgi:hypothetical protein